MIEIIPALMPEKLNDIDARLRAVRGVAHGIQIDVMDGLFVPEKSWPYTAPEEFEKILAGELILPFRNEFQYEADLMIAQPETVFRRWLSSGFSRIVIHAESTKKLDDILSLRRGGIRVGIGVNIETPNETIYPFVPKADFIQCMGITPIGFQGRLFDPRVLAKIEDFHARFPDCIISIDGGVRPENTRSIFRAGARRLCVGSAVWKDPHPEKAVAHFQDIAREFA